MTDTPLSPGPLSPGATIGILGGGQLGRMLAMAAARLGFRTQIYEPGDAPAAQVANGWTRAAWTDEQALAAFAGSVDVVTYEWENVPAETLDLLEASRPIRPGRAALRVAQDRLDEKRFLEGLGLTVAPFRDVPDLGALTAALAELGRPAILKTRRLGYDGKGQVRIDDATGAAEAFAAIEGADAILEGVVTFDREISVIVARGVTGETVCFDPGENVHAEGILRTTTVPAALTASQRQDAVLLAGRIVSALDYVGVMGVELFATGTGLVVNEIAPRVHNSGHWTEAACAVDQFEQHIRAIAGLPLGDGRRHADAVMENLIGDDMDRLPELLAAPDTRLHLYGKAETRPGRKMGHATRLTRR
ncbi:5-(carboxyamino)imidazole ribonucleotide synthase [Jannaschia seohaensis]|uniref:N5-carboxyaminoimidazole ribonucleotide synthase n=1 Tax=Jannaschia seohaensis TaxID=475081 RepID=A0A2Y9B2M3_9RHOB|nr:5-(carboxyamino)imidazole ribonucleotide synthase [Jannaschia seohaensis]PWJ14453.1 5-(carboxyamino)imidazole ribonucleotide synthase [Jannaschia seohaensis]SSA50195.1 5-(carboxyamino)imidazole ribonucleotide synthase [Jannaschia seohaensis]